MALLDYLRDNSIVPNVANFRESFTLTALDDSTEVTTLRVNSGADLIDAPALALVAKSRGLNDIKTTGEVILIESYDLGDPDLLNIRRFDPKAHAKGELISINIFAENLSLSNDALEEALTTNANLKTFLRLSFGLEQNKIIRTTFDPTTDGKVTNASAVITVNALKGFAGDDPVTYAGETFTYGVDLDFPDPLNERRDLVEVNADGELFVNQGTQGVSPVTPTATADSIILAMIQTNNTSVVSITDMREFY